MYIMICTQQSDFQVQRTPLIFSTVFLLCFHAYTLPDLGKSDVPGRSDACRIFRISQLNVFIRSNTCVYWGVPSWNPNSNHWNLIGRSISAAPPMLLPSSILPSPSSDAPSFAQEKCRRAVQKCYFIFIILLRTPKFWTCLTRKCVRVSRGLPQQIYCVHSVGWASV